MIGPSSHRARARATVALLASVVAAPALRAQGEPATIPTVLASALLGGIGEIAGAGPHFVVDRVPPSWPSALVPPAGARVVGGVTFGPMRMAVFRYPRAVDPIASFEPVAKRAGFKPFDTRSDVPGFALERRPEPAMFCGDSGSLAIVRIDSTATMRTVGVTIMRDREAAGCGTGAMETVKERGAPLQIPTLHAPRGVAVRPGSRGWSNDSMELSAQLDTTLSADAMLAHYSAQLTAAGWKALGAPARAEGMAAQQLSTRDASGTDWRGAVFVITVGDRRDVLLRMVRALRE
jgi:hypothetical protein